MKDVSVSLERYEYQYQLLIQFFIWRWFDDSSDSRIKLRNSATKRNEVFYQCIKYQVASYKSLHQSIKYGGGDLLINGGYGSLAVVDSLSSLLIGIKKSILLSDNT